MLQAAVLPRLPLEELACRVSSRERRARACEGRMKHETQQGADSDSSSSNSNSNSKSNSNSNSRTGSRDSSFGDDGRSTSKRDIVSNILRSDRLLEASDSGDDLSDADRESDETEACNSSAAAHAGGAQSASPERKGPRSPRPGMATAAEARAEATLGPGSVLGRGPGHGPGSVSGSVSGRGPGHGPLMWREAPSLRDLCQRSLAQQVNLRTAIPLLANAEALNCSELTGFCEEFILRSSQFSYEVYLEGKF